MNRGSEWRIWDLHVHTPLSIENNYNCDDNNEGWEKYISALEQLPQDIKVLGINDYLFIDGYRKVLEYKTNGRLKNIDLILPVVEFRLSKFCGHQQFKRINYHVIFSNEVSADVIQFQFLNALSNKYTLSADSQKQWGGVITRKNLENLGQQIIDSVPAEEKCKYGTPLKEGFNNLNIDVNNILDTLENAPQFFKGKYITAIGKTEWDEFKWNDTSIAEKKSIINATDIVFTAAESVEKYQNAKKKLIEQGVNSRLLDCSDAHSFADATNVKDRLGNCKCWIKADTTFEGLKQILYEPEDRVKVQTTKPDDKNIYQVIDSITLSEKDFWDDTIYLNSNLNTIIGGRSTGKSTLLKAIAAKHGCEIDNEDEKKFVESHLDSVSIKWVDDNNQTGREIEYFKQGYMHDIAFEENKFKKLVERIIKSKNKYDFLQNYEETIKGVSKTIINDIFTLFQTYNEYVNKSTELKALGKKEGVEQQIELLKNKINELQKNSILTDEEKRVYEAQVAKLKEYQEQIEYAEKDLKLLAKLRSTTLFNDLFEEQYQLSTLSLESNSSVFLQKFENIKSDTLKRFKELVEEHIELTNLVKEKLNRQCGEITESASYIKGMSVIEGNKELKDVNTKVKEEEEKLAEINRRQEQCNKIKDDVKNLIESITNKHCEIKKAAENVKNNLEINYEGLKITAAINYRKEDLRQFLETRLNQRGYERQGYLSDFVANYNSDNKKYISGILKQLLYGELLLKNSCNAQNVATELLTTNWYSLNYELLYQKDSFKEMSEGKRAFVILLLLLDFSDKKCPILIDQPEDSLDNRAIYTDLVAYLKRKKTERQIILVSHNSNVVVSADAENVIVANQNGIGAKNKDGNKFQYINGALESTSPKDSNQEFILNSQGIREHVCEILEGGKDAFEKREKKYGLK